MSGIVSDLMGLAGGLAQRIGDLFQVPVGQSQTPAVPTAPPPSYSTAPRPDFFGQGLAAKPDFYGQGIGVQLRPTYAMPTFNFWTDAARIPSLGTPSTTASTSSGTSGTQTVSYPTGQGGTASTGLTPGVAKWAEQTRQTFGDIQGLDPDTMLAIMTNESGGDPNVQNHQGLPAYGLFQLWNQPGLTADQQFQAAHQLAQQKMDGINAAYAKNGLNPDERTRARDFALAWAGHFDYGTGQPNPDSRDAGSGQSAGELTNVFLSNYDQIKAGRQQATAVGNGSGSVAVDKALAYVGSPYTNDGIRATGNPADSFDCSSLVGYALGLPRNLWNAQVQYDHSQRITADQLQPGDLVFFQGTNPDDPSARPVTHVGIYMGNGKMINAQTSGVAVADLNSPYWQQHLYGYGRMAGQQATTY